MNKIIKQLLVIVIFASSFFSCNVADQNKCLLKRIVETENKRVEGILVDSINSWIADSIYLVKNYSYKKVNWKIGGVILSNDHRKSISWLLKIDGREKTTLNSIKFLAGNKKEDGWHFYFNGMPTIYVRKKDVKEEETLKNLQDIAFKTLIKGGLFEDGNCAINENYLRGWLEGLEEKHIEFLNNQ